MLFLRTLSKMRFVAVFSVIALVAVVTAFDFDDAANGLEPLATASPAAGGPALDELSLNPVGEFIAPVEVFTRPGDDRIFVVELMGAIQATDPAATAPEPALILDLSELTAVVGEHGVLGAAFHPTNDLLYVHYSDLDGTTIVAEYAVDPDTAVADPNSARIVLTVDQPFDNHNGGELTFGPDGYLYLGLGDGGSANDPYRSALDLTSRLGKILRIDPTPSGDVAFTVPADNPFVDVADADPTIWSFGLRNPWRFSFDATSGDLWIADVGQDAWEEINRASASVEGTGAGAGVSFGWSAFEGNERFNDDQADAGHTEPFATYERADGRCSISGGAVYRGQAISALDGWYVFGDYCTGEVLGFDTALDDGEREIVTLATTPALVAVAAGPDGELYAVSVGGMVSRLG